MTHFATKSEIPEATGHARARPCTYITELTFVPLRTLAHPVRVTRAAVLAVLLAYRAGLCADSESRIYARTSHHHYMKVEYMPEYQHHIIIT